MKKAFAIVGIMEEIYTITDRKDTYPVHVCRSARKTIALEIREGVLYLRVPKTLQEPEIRLFLQKHIRWIRNRMTYCATVLPDTFTEEEKRRLKKQAGEILKARTAYFARLMGVSYNRIFIKEQKTVWGSCSTKGNLNFNWKLIFTGPDQLEYVVVHELAHLKQMNHSPAFWREVEAVLPDYRERRKKLKAFRP